MVAGEIARLAVVQGHFAPRAAPARPAPRAAAPPPPPPPAPKPAPREQDITVPDLLSQLPPPSAPVSTPGAPRFEPRPAGGKGAGVPPRTIVLESERRTPPNDELAFLKSVSEEAKPARTEAKPAPAAPAPAATPAAAAPTGARTLKCAECGAMNRPTEWYCEKCGAELAAL
jgi:hypothetical protein